MHRAYAPPPTHITYPQTNLYSSPLPSPKIYSHLNPYHLLQLLWSGHMPHISNVNNWPNILGIEITSLLKTGVIKSVTQWNKSISEIQNQSQRQKKKYPWNPFLDKITKITHAMMRHTCCHYSKDITLCRKTWSSFHHDPRGIFPPNPDKIIWKKCIYAHPRLDPLIMFPGKVCVWLSTRVVCKCRNHGDVDYHTSGWCIYGNY